MSKPRCQHCNEDLTAFTKTCPFCRRPLLGTTAVNFIGDSVIEFIQENIESNPNLAKKKASLYAKLCQDFLCRSGEAYLRAGGLPGPFDDRTRLSVEDVIASHRQHVKNLAEIIRLTKGREELRPVIKRIEAAHKQIDEALRAWLASNAGSLVTDGLPDDKTDRRGAFV